MGRQNLCCILLFLLLLVCSGPPNCMPSLSLTTGLLPTPCKVMDGQRCAAGDLCSAPPGSDLSSSTHCCLECGNKIHCTIWCGKSINKLTGSKITANRLSTNGSAKFKTADLELTCICKGCIKRLDPSALDPTDQSTLLPW